MIQNLIFGIHLFISDVLIESLKVNLNLKSITHFTIQFCSISLILQTSTHSTLQKIYSSNTIENLTHFTSFPANMFLVEHVFGCSQKKTFALHHFCVLRNCILEALGKQMSVYCYM